MYADASVAPLEQRVHPRHSMVRTPSLEPDGGFFDVVARRDGNREGNGGSGHRALGLHPVRREAALLWREFHAQFHLVEPLAIFASLDRVGVVWTQEGRVHGRDRVARGGL